MGAWRWVVDSWSVKVNTQPEGRCDARIFEEGVPVMMIAQCPSTVIEAMVVRAREALKLKIDWHYSGGRGIVLVLGTEKEQALVRERLESYMPVWSAL